SPSVVNILFLDEISAAPQSVQAAAYQITLDRVVGEHRLPENCIVIAAGNRVTDKSVAYKMPKALANRLLHIEVEGSFSSWLDWAVKNGINEKVVGFLAFRADMLFGFDAKSDDLAFATPRSWEMVSNILNTVSNNVTDMYALIAGLVGSGIALEFRSWSELHRDLPDIEGIFNGTELNLPKTSDTMYAVVSAMLIYAKEHRYELNRIGNSIKYAEKMPADFVALLLRSYEAIEEDYKSILMQIPEYLAVAGKRSIMRNGSV
ncbi:MAG: hypothetical protein IJW79_12265, partial [Clostridia bacterium]|nr:hypothetical protein [Clostridia bacterium]